MKIAVDLDGTLCSWIPGRYELAEPVEGAIGHVRQLHAMGHTIWIYTGRGAALGSEKAARLRWEEITRSQLVRWKVPFDDLIFAKPPFDALIDDRAVSFRSDWVHEIELIREKLEPS